MYVLRDSPVPLLKSCSGQPELRELAARSIMADAFSFRSLKFLGSAISLLTPHNLELLDPVARLHLSDIDVTLRVYRQSVSVRKFTQ